jgi:hypothetical protein
VKRPVAPRRSWPAERRLQDRFLHGAALDLSTGEPQFDDPQKGGTWDRGRVVGAGIVGALLLGTIRPEAGQVGVVRLRGARIAGKVSLAWAQLRHPLILEDCFLDEELDLTDATAPSVSLTRCWLPGLDGTALRTEGRLILDGSHLRRLLLVGARIGGELSLQDTVITNPGGRAVDAEACRTEGRLLALRMQAQGEVRLIGASIGGELDFDGAHLLNPGGRAIQANRITVDGSMFCSAGFEASGQLRLGGATIADHLDLSDATITHKPDDYALQGEDLHAQTLLLPEGHRISSSVNLMGAQISVLDGNPGHWPARNYLDGLNYDILVPEPEAHRMLRWLRTDPRGFRARPYEQLAAYYRRAGHDDQARRVLLARQRRRYFRHGTRPAAKAWGVLQEITVGHGYRPWLAVLWLAALITAGSFYFAAHPPQPASAAQHTAFDPLPYTIDLLVPIISLGQKESWHPSGVSELIAYLLIASGWTLATSLVAGATRILVRD